MKEAGEKRAQEIEANRAALIQKLADYGTTYDADWNSTSYYNGQVHVAKEVEKYWLNYSWAYL
jgi:hypothetical protein